MSLKKIKIFPQPIKCLLIRYPDYLLCVICLLSKMLTAFTSRLQMLSLALCLTPPPPPPPLRAPYSVSNDIGLWNLIHQWFHFSNRKFLEVFPFFTLNIKHAISTTFYIWFLLFDIKLTELSRPQTVQLCCFPVLKGRGLAPASLWRNPLTSSEMQCLLFFRIVSVILGFVFLCEF